YKCIYTEDYLKRKIKTRPERSELIRMHILKETSAEPSLQAKQLQLKRARLADDLNDKISHRPGPMELIHKNILPVHSSIKQAIIGKIASLESIHHFHPSAISWLEQCFDWIFFFFLSDPLLFYAFIQVWALNIPLHLLQHLTSFLRA
uniref:Phosphatase and actin regulator n=1 Tax=Sphaeramia orbicularis TaxID=375764 RepID=A0A672Z2A4_9TELE